MGGGGTCLGGGALSGRTRACRPCKSEREREYCFSGFSHCRSSAFPDWRHYSKFVATIARGFMGLCEGTDPCGAPPQSPGKVPASRYHTCRNAWPHDPSPSGVGVVAFSSLAQLGGDRPSAIPPPFGSRSAETASWPQKWEVARRAKLCYNVMRHGLLNAKRERI